MLEFVKVATGHNYCVYLRGERAAWVGTIKPTGPGAPGKPEFHPRTPMGWTEDYKPTEDERERIETFLLTLAPERL